MKFSANRGQGCRERPAWGGGMQGRGSTSTKSTSGTPIVPTFSKSKVMAQNRREETLDRHHSKLRRLFSMCTYKLHALGHCVAAVTRLGTTDSYSTQIVCEYMIFFFNYHYWQICRENLNIDGWSIFTHGQINARHSANKLQNSNDMSRSWRRFRSSGRSKNLNNSYTLLNQTLQAFTVLHQMSHLRSLNPCQKHCPRSIITFPAQCD
jgi:hypothetical protein